MSLEDFLTQNNVEYHEHGGHHHATQGRLQVDCPFCSPKSGKFRMGLGVSYPVASCWTCGSFSLYKALIELTGLSYNTVKGVCKDFEDVLPVQLVNRRGKLELPDGICDLLPIHHKYLRGRCLDPDKLVRLWGIQGIGLSARFAWRILVPIKHFGEVVSWTTRSVSDDGKRYLSASPDQERISHKEILFGSDLARHAISIHEGPFDVFNIGPGATATCGVSYTRQQVSQMARFPIRIICFDNEPEAQNRARKLCEELSTLPGETTNVNLDADDPGSASKEEVRKFRRLLE